MSAITRVRVKLKVLGDIPGDLAEEMKAVQQSTKKVREACQAEDVEVAGIAE
ncbi:hypothetical protein [Bailinhaonella thermotolerans]|uniref:hypothetical protein n=1 Tax=Bailinhaonella thermotolerans TaxID=1070861 RepID=UPI00192A224F|nr:hypothetical protein [Bailinhaonella thermotolerans]